MKKNIITVILLVLLFGVCIAAPKALKIGETIHRDHVCGERVEIKRIYLDGHVYYLTASHGFKSGGVSLTHSESCPCKNKEDKKK